MTSESKPDCWMRNIRRQIRVKTKTGQSVVKEEKEREREREYDKYIVGEEKKEADGTEDGSNEARNLLPSTHMPDSLSPSGLLPMCSLHSIRQEPRVVDVYNTW